jgi:hypothetical protein
VGEGEKWEKERSGRRREVGEKIFFFFVLLSVTVDEHDHKIALSPIVQIMQL